jgi:hypothetical protein
MSEQQRTQLAALLLAVICLVSISACASPHRALSRPQPLEQIKPPWMGEQSIEEK